MAFKIVWSQEATLQFKEVISYLEGNWTNREIGNFIKKTFEKLEIISVNPMIARKSFSNTTREILITRHNLLIFDLDHAHGQIFILSIWDTRRHPITKVTGNKKQ